MPTDIQNPDLKPENIPVWFNGTGAETNNTFGVIAHQYKFGKWIKVKEKDEEFQKFIPRFTIMHTLEFTDNSRYFHEVEPNPYFDFTDSRGRVYFYGTAHQPYINSQTGTVGSELEPFKQYLLAPRQQYLGGDIWVGAPG